MFSQEPAGEQEANANHKSVFKASIHITSAEFPLAKTSYIAKHHEWHRAIYSAYSNRRACQVPLAWLYNPINRTE